MSIPETFLRIIWKKAKCATNPLEDGTLSDYKIIAIPITTLTREAVEGLGLDRKSADRCKNFFTLGLAFWLYDRPMDQTLQWLEKKFARSPELKEANIRCLNAGYHFGETSEVIPNTYKVSKAEIAPGTYREITGNVGVALGLITAAKLASKQLVCSYPITPASEILQELSAKRTTV